MYAALITLCNEHGEIRTQFNTVTESQGEMKYAFAAMLETQEKRGQTPAVTVCVDNPAQERDF